MTSPPEWVTQTPSTLGVHTEPAGYQWVGLSEEQLNELRTNLIESIVSAVMEAIAGFFPFATPAIELLGTYFSDLLGLLGGPLGLGTGNVTVNPDASQIPLLGPVLGLLGEIPIVGPMLQQVVDMLFGFLTGNFGANNTSINSLLDLFSNPFELVTGFLDAVLAPAGGLTTNSLIPSFLLGGLSQGADRNILPDPNFASADYVVGRNVWTWDSERPTGQTEGGSVATVADSTNHILRSVPWQTVVNQTITAAAKVKWSGVAASGAAFRVGLDVYDGNDTWLTTLSSAATTISNPAASGGWTTLRDTFTIPNAASTRLNLTVTDNVSAGTVKYSAAELIPDSRVDAGLLGNMDELPFVQDLINIFTGQQSELAGLSGLSDVIDELMSILSIGGLGTGAGGIPFGTGSILDGFQGIVDSIMSGLGIGGSGHSVAALANAVGDLATTTADIVLIAQNTAYDFAYQAINNPMHHGIDPSLHAVFPLTANMGSSATTVDIVAANSKIGFINLPVATVKNSVAWLGYGTTDITAAYICIYRVDTTDGSLDPVWSSADIKANMSSSLAWTYVSIDPLECAEGDWLAVELFVNGTGTHTVVGGPNHWIPAHPTAFPKQLAATRSSPTVPAAAIANPTYSANVPWLALSSADIDSGGIQYTHPTETTTFTTPGNFVYNWPDWANYVDCIGVGGGGGGQGEMGINQGQGGGAGHWGAITLQRGEQVAVNVTQLDIFVGDGGAGVGYFGTGNPGEPSTVQWYDPTDHLQTLTCIGGEGGNSNSLFGYGGAGAGDYTYRSTVYHGGSGSVINFPGNAPGGGGGGAAIFVPLSGSGAPGEIWCVARQA